MLRYPLPASTPQADLSSPDRLPSAAGGQGYLLDPAVPAQDDGHDLVSSGVTVGDPTTATAAAGAIEWVIYVAGTYSAYAPPGSIELDLTGSSGAIWVAIADFSSNRWQYLPVPGDYSAAISLSLPSSGQYYRDSDGLAFLALIAYDAASLNFTGGSVASNSVLVNGGMRADFEIAINPLDPWAGTTAVVNGVSLTVVDGTAVWDAASESLAMQMVINNVGAHSTSGMGGRLIEEDMREADINWSHSLREIYMALYGMPKGDIPLSTSSDPFTVHFHVKGGTPFTFRPSVRWVAAHDLICFESTGDGDVQRFFLIDPDGSNPEELPGLWGWEPCWSPDRLSFALANYRDIAVADYTGAATQLTWDDSAWQWNEHPAWSPDGSMLCFDRYTDASDSYLEIFIMNADGTGQTQVTYNTDNDSKDICPDWSPDGRRICWQREWTQYTPYSAEVDITVINTDGTNQEILTPGQRWQGEPEWSPDGRRIAFTSTQHMVDPAALQWKYMSIYTMLDNGTDVRRVTQQDDDPYPGQYSDLSPTWSPDGSRIAFIRHFHNFESGYIKALCVVNADGTGLTTIYDAQDVDNVTW